MLFVHDLFKNMWVYFLKLKSHVLNGFKMFKALVKNQPMKSIKVLDSCNQEALKTIHHTLHSIEKWSGKEEKSYHHGDRKVYVSEQTYSLQVLSGCSMHITVASQLVSNESSTQEHSRRSMD